MSTHKINVDTTRAHHWSYSINGGTETHVAAGVSSANVTLEDGNTTITVKAYGSGNEYLNASDSSVVAYSSCVPQAEAVVTPGYQLTTATGWGYRKFGGHGGSSYPWYQLPDDVDLQNIWGVNQAGQMVRIPYSATGVTGGSHGGYNLPGPMLQMAFIQGNRSTTDSTDSIIIVETQSTELKNFVFATFVGGVWPGHGSRPRTGPDGWDGILYVGGTDAINASVAPTTTQITTIASEEICADGEGVTVTPLSVTASVTTNVLCHGASTGAVSCTPIGGSGGYQYSWTDSSGEEVGSTQNVTGLPAGDYTIEVYDSDYSSAAITITITQPDAALTISSTTSYAENFTIGST